MYCKNSYRYTGEDRSDVRLLNNLFSHFTVAGMPAWSLVIIYKDNANIKSAVACHRTEVVGGSDGRFSESD
jgi:hypothetical protein